MFRIAARHVVAIGLGIIGLVLLMLDAELAGQGFKQVCPPCAAVARAQGGIEDIHPGALADIRWALGLQGINQPLPLSSPESQRLGLGATIVQIDTGVTGHPLLHAFDATNNPGGVDATAADDLYAIGHKNIDTLLNGFLRFPGHGTKTSSVIISRPVGVFSTTTPTGEVIGMTGAARGARVIAVRATQGVVLFPGDIGELNAKFERVVTAINAAADGRFGKVDVISMSLGGWPPHNDICTAVTHAANSGILVVVAAGNEVKRAKFPALCPDAIAIAGSTFDQKPWSGSAGAPEVVVAAPAEGVWTASVMGGAYCLDASSGTSFATALVAGMAAEWVVEMRAKNRLPPVPTSAFKDALRQSARPWSTPAWQRSFGAGIADQTRLMQLGVQP